ncbi:hypothetical protein [Akkermansia muciniphila]|uniref:hypothetical protein n=1 Tax=Akkermansia muciniphila TaxID=239935 RepID=UPI00201D45C5|nr:hypothetical protein [Akkermansia muciniphila]MCI9265266.1 hypothetical protein [Akkermansia muciniphila]MCL6680622.1 hypothetical protein [Akkermansia muciniphila]WMB18103.1 hypothetical protein O4G21_03020 [Akkermansia muciniphila]
MFWWGYAVLAGTILLSWPGAESVFPFCGTAGDRRIAVNSVRERNFRRSVAVFFQYCIPCVAGRRRGSQESIGRAGFRKPVHSREGWKEYIERRMQQSREKGGSKPLSYLYSNRKILVDDSREVILLWGSTGRSVFLPVPPVGRNSCFFMIFPFNSRMGFHVEKRELRGEGMDVAGEKAGMAADAGKMEFRLNGRSVRAMLNVPLAS